MTNLAHLSKFKPESLMVKELDHWIICVRSKQVTLGSCVILLKREEESLARISSAEAVDFIRAVSWFEEESKRRFGADKFNYVAAMMKDPFVHFHAFPRYAEPREALGLRWADEQWPKAISLLDVVTDESTLVQLVVLLRGDH